jgi:hypothetical protein
MDEAISLLISRLPLPYLLTATAADNHPPLFYILSIPSVIPFLAAFLILFILSKRSSFLFLLSPLHLYFASQYRMYSLATFFYVCLLASTSRPKTFFWFALFGLYTHYYFIPGILVLSLFHKRVRNPSLLAFLLFIPWLAFWTHFSHPNIWSPPLILSVPGSIVSFTAGGVGSTTLRTIFNLKTHIEIQALVIFTSAWMFIKFIKSRQISKNLFIVTFLCCLPIFSMRAILIFSPLYYLSIATSLKRSQVLILITFFIIFNLSIYSTDYWKPSLAKMSSQISSLPITTLIIHTNSYTYFPARIANPNYHHYLISPSGLSQQTSKLLGVEHITSNITSPAYLVSSITSVTPATITLHPYATTH